MQTRAYLDWASTAPLSAAAAEAMAPYLAGSAGNASSVHGFGRRARAALEQAREQVATALGAHPAQLVFTSGATEADNLALLGVARAARAARAGTRRHQVVSAIEHAAVLRPAQLLEREGFTATTVPVDSAGRVDASTLEAALRDDTLLVALMAVNNEVGTVQPVAAAAAAAHARGALLLCDSVQALGVLPVDVRAWDVDLLSVSSHKIGGPQGVGALYCRAGVALSPLLLGGEQENQRRAGTENVAGAVGFGAAVAHATANLAGRVAGLSALGDRLVRGVLTGVPGARLLGDPASHLACFEFTGTDAETLLFALDMEGIAASSGAACSSHTLEPSHVLRAMGVADPRAAVRFSWGPTTAAEEVEALLAILPGLVARNRRSCEGVRALHAQRTGARGAQAPPAMSEPIRGAAGKGAPERRSRQRASRRSDVGSEESRQ